MRGAGKSRVRSRIGAVALLSVAVVAVGAPAGAKLDPSSPSRQVTAGPAVAWPLDIAAASVRQQGFEIEFDVRTIGGFSATSIAAQPGRSLCLDLHRAVAGAAVRRMCLALASGKARIVRQDLDRSGNAVSTKVVGSTIRRPAPTRMVASFKASDAGLGRGPFRWRAISRWSGGACGSVGCADFQPASPAAAKYVRPVPVGCSTGGRSFRLNGSRAHRVVALSFDDGPSRHTPAVLNLLRRYGAKATFFQVGMNMGGQSGLQKRILLEGSTIGDHSWSHPVLSAGGAAADSEVTRTRRRIARQTGFTPCVFRAPYGAVSSRLIGLVRRRGMLTIQWDVDPLDWRRPGAGAIASRVLSQVRPGSIILLHDGGGERSQSVAAAGTILRTLKRRGYRVTTVEDLLGLQLEYR